MTHITALLVALTLIGPPITSMLCLTERHHEPMSAGHCHDDMAAAEAPMIGADQACGLTVLAPLPYVRDRRTDGGAALLAIALVPLAPAVAAASAPPPARPLMARRSMPALVLRI